MALKGEWQMTDVGALPNDWTVVPLADCTDKIADGEHLTPRRTQNGYFLLSARNILNGRIDVSDVDFVGESEFRRIRKRCDPDPGDVLISCSGTVGRVSTLPNGFQCVLVRSAAFFKPTSHLLSGSYAMYVLQSRSGQRQIAVSLSQAAQANLFLNHIQRLLIPLPPTKAEQEAIAGALSDADGLIESLERLIDKKRQLKQGVMEELLTGERRLPGFNEEWNIVKLGEVANIRSGGTPSTKSPSYWDGSIPWCTPTDITALEGKRWLSRTSRTISSEGLQASSAEIIPANSVVMTSRATIGECAINAVPVTTNQGFKNFVPTRINVEFLFYLLLTQREGFVRLCGGSTFLEIGKAQLQGYAVSVPPTIKEQAEIGRLLSAFDEELETLEAKLCKARQIKQGMMQPLLTGKVRLV